MSNQVSSGGSWEGVFIDYFEISSHRCREGNTNERGESCWDDKTTSEILSNYVYEILLQKLFTNPSNYTFPLLP